MMKSRINIRYAFLTLILSSVAYAVCPPLPTVSVSLNPSTVQAGDSTTVTWSSDADSCTATGSWAGTKATSGSEIVGPLTGQDTFTLTCTNLAGDGSDTATTTLAGTEFGLEWPGDAHITGVRRMLYWADPPPAYPMTYIFKVFPRKKTNNHAYFTTFFWGTNGPFDCDWNYYGAHPYPVSPPSGPGRWEAGSDCSDETAPFEVEWDRWHQQAVTTEQSGSHLLVNFYYDLPDTSKLVQNNGYLRTNPPNPVIMMGQSPDDGNGKSWGGYDGWEELNGIIRGIQIYSCKLSISDIQAEIANPLSTTQGQACIWYLNLNPRPDDVADDSGNGNDPQWEGTTALEWSQ